MIEGTNVRDVMNDPLGMGGTKSAQPKHYGPYAHVKSENDPNGKSPNEPGAKLDAGKVRVALMESGFPRALMAVAEVTTFGAKKYTDGGWQSVPDAIKRYSDAGGRHRLKEAMGEMCDTDSGLLHAAHCAWNALATLELKLRDMEVKQSR